MQFMGVEIQDSQKRLKELIQEGQRIVSSIQFERLTVRGYEQVIKVTEKNSHLQAIIAIHDTTLGPALGGVRIHSYRSFQEALDDVLRLAKGMTYKAALAEVGLGGGKSVILTDHATQKTPELLFAFGLAVEKLGGIYICAEDMGCTPQDCAVIHRATKYVVGLPASSGDPGPFTAWGVFRGIQATAKKLFGTDSLEGRTVAVQGLGSVGSHLVPLLFWAGAKLSVSDMDVQKAQSMSKKFGGVVVSPDEILSAECDILVPCARGGVVNDHTIPRLRCKAIAGAANNQLQRDAHASILRERGILYAPDFVLNAGGLLNVAAELTEQGYHPAFPRGKIQRIYDTLTAIYDIADRNHDSTHAAALALAEYRMKYGIGKRVYPPVFYTHE
jgi:leucine dehydrogenase